MSLPIWTPDALSSEFRAYQGSIWRIVEAQHRVSTLKLVDSLAEQNLLEDIIEQTKPKIPEDCQHLDYLLATPFRYGSVYPKGSRFRRAGRTAGVFYAAEQVETALAELIFYRFLFFAESPDTTPPDNATDYSAFSAEVASQSVIDLTQPPLERDRIYWMDPIVYEACQGLSDAARRTDCTAIRYQSVRDPKGYNLALLSGVVFEKPIPLERQTWRIRLTGTTAQAICDFPPRSLEIAKNSFDDPRLYL